MTGAAVRTSVSSSFAVTDAAAAGPRPERGAIAAVGPGRPCGWLGAPAVGGLGLPDADPAPDQLYAPRGVWLDDERVIVADTGNHRLLIWQRRDGALPAPHAPADVVLGQPDMTTEGAQAGGRGPVNGMRLPTGVLVVDGRLVVADAWNHRLLVWHEVPTVSDTPPDVVLGQPDAESTRENRGGDCGPHGFYWPFGLAMIDGRFWVADTGNRRVLIWNELPLDPNVGPDVVLGQPDARSREENRGGINASSFRWPHDVAAAGGVVWVADAGNHRLLGWTGPIEGDRPADLVLGQEDFTSGAEFPYVPQTAWQFRFPYAVSVDPHPGGDGSGPGSPAMVVADTSNNRILTWTEAPTTSTAPADGVLGQFDMAAAGENRWDAVGDDTFCWPYGTALHRGVLAVADSGNNRVTLWDLRSGGVDPASP